MKLNPHHHHHQYSSSISTNNKSSVKKGRNEHNSTKDTVLSNALFNKTLSSKIKCKLPHSPTSTAIFNSNTNTKKAHHNTTNHKIDININVNYPKRKHKLKPSTPNKLNDHKINVNAANKSIYQNNLNISLTNNSQSQNPFPFQANPITYQTNPNEAPTKDKETNVFFSPMNMKEFTLKNDTPADTNEQTANFTSEINKAAYIHIKNSLIEGLALISKDGALRNKYSLYKTALIQLGELCLIEEEKELIRVITLGLSNIIRCFQQEKEATNKSYSKLYLKSLQLKKNNKRKDEIVNKLKEEVNSTQIKHSAQDLKEQGGTKDIKMRRVHTEEKGLNNNRFKGKQDSCDDLNDDGMELLNRMNNGVSHSYTHLPIRCRCSLLSNSTNYHHFKHENDPNEQHFIRNTQKGKEKGKQLLPQQK